MVSQPTRFAGLNPWAAGADCIECETDRGFVDLHNYATLEAIELPCRPDPELVLRFRDTRGAFRLVFSEVLELSFQQDPDDGLPGARNWDPEEVSTRYSIDYAEDEGTPSGSFAVDTILGLVRFRAAQVSFVWE